MNIMVTGSDGYIGRGVVSRLLDRGHRVSAFGLSSSGLCHSMLHESIGNVFQYEFNPETEELPDAVIHLAWRNGFNHRDVSHLDDLPLHYRFIERAASAGVKHIVVMGTMHEVGYHEGAIDEDTPCNPTSLYGVSKNALRQLSMEVCRQQGVVLQWLRGFYLVSNDGRGDSVFSKIMKAEQAGQKTFPFTSGKNRYDFLPYEEFCAQVVATVEQTEVNGIINICSGKAVALGEYVEMFIRENKLSIKLDYGKFPDRPYDSPAIWGDGAKIKSILAKDDVND